MIKLVIESETNGKLNTLLSVQLNTGDPYLLWDMGRSVLLGTNEILSQEINKDLVVGHNHTFVTKFGTNYIVTWHVV